MNYHAAIILLAFSGLVMTLPVPEVIIEDSFPPARILLRGPEVPRNITTKNFGRPPKFGSSWKRAAAGGIGDVTDVNCLLQATAGQACTNSKADGDIQGQVDALIYRALEENTGKVFSVASPDTRSSRATRAEAPAASSTTATSGVNVQTFTGDLGGFPPPVIFTAGAARPFAVDGSTAVNKGAAVQLSCSIQHNNCADAANSGALAGGVGQCDTQLNACNAAGGV